jgi:hypothetical protein
MSLVPQRRANAGSVLTIKTANAIRYFRPTFALLFLVLMNLTLPTST